MGIDPDSGVAHAMLEATGPEIVKLVRLMEPGQWYGGKWDDYTSAIQEALIGLNCARMVRIEQTGDGTIRYRSTSAGEFLRDKSIKSNLAHLKAALRWANRVGLLAKAPSIEMPKRASETMKGRPVTAEEFDRMIDAVPKVVGEADAALWKRFLRGLWLSGLRISEALALAWDDQGSLRVDLTGKRPMLWIPAALEKGNTERLLPITPDFAEFLFATPEDERTGFVFPLPLYKGERPPRYRASHIVASIGGKAGVKVSTQTKTGGVKYASAHDLRRSFGERWAARVMPQVPRERMRHESVTTTMTFYVGRNAERTADAVWEAFEKGNTEGNTC